MTLSKQLSPAKTVLDRGSKTTVAVGVIPLRKPQRDLPISPALRAHQATVLRRQLAAHVDGALDIHVTDNRSVMLSVWRDSKHRRYRVRLHHIFVHAPTEVLQALGRYVVVNDRTASRELNRYIQDNDFRIERRRRPRNTVARTDGAVYDLQTMFDDLNQRYFDGQVKAQITWGRNANRQRARSSVRLGSFVVEENLIRIHPGLDQPWVPNKYLQWVVYHEMLHAVHPIPVINGRRSFHTPAFARDERRFEHAELARDWERRNLAALLRI